MTRRHFPLSSATAAWGTLWLALLALVCQGSPMLQEAFTLRREGMTLVQGWQVFTCHFSHWTSSHFWWDWLVFIGLGWLCERQSHQAFWLTLASSSLVIGLGFLFLLPHLSSYRGLSGIDSALFALWWVQSYRGNGGRVNANRWIYWLLGFGFAAKLLFEAITSTTLFVDSSPAGFVPVPLAHLLGALCGVTVGVVCSRHGFLGKEKEKCRIKYGASRAGMERRVLDTA